MLFYKNVACTFGQNSIVCLVDYYRKGVHLSDGAKKF